MAISYNPAKDELAVKFRPAKGKPSKVVHHLKLWWDSEGNICAVDIERYAEALEEFKRRLNAVRLGGLWTGIAISEEEIREVRKELTAKLEEKW